MVTDRTLPHAGATGEIRELPLTFPANSIRNASGSRLCSKLRSPVQDGLWVWMNAILVCVSGRSLGKIHSSEVGKVFSQLKKDI